MASQVTTPQRQTPRVATFPWTHSAASVGTPSSAAALTPPSQRSAAASVWLGEHPCSPPGSRTVPVPGRIHTSALSPVGGRSAHAAHPHTPTTPDRFIADRTSQDVSLAHFLLTAEGCTTPVTARYTVAGAGLCGGDGGEDEEAVVSARLSSGPLSPLRGTAAPPLPLSRERAAWGAHSPFGASFTPNDSDDDNAYTVESGVLAAGPLMPPAQALARTAGHDAGAVSSASRGGVQAVFDSWRGDSRAGSVAGVAPGDSSPLPASTHSGWGSPLLGSTLSGRYASRGGDRRSPSASLPRGGTAFTVASRTSTARSPSMHTPHPGGVDLSASMSASSTVTMETEPYTSKLARALFTNTTQTSVLGLHSGGGTRGGGDEENDLLDGAPHAARAGATAPLHTTTTTREQSRFGSALAVVYEQNRSANFQSQSFRVIAQTPERILDAADMVDDFYLNLVDWSSSNVLCVALQSAVYLWEAASCNITQLPITRSPEATSSLVCGVQWAPDGHFLSLGFNDGSVEVWDVAAQQVVQTWRDHTQRVGALSWAGGETSVVASGSKDATICLRDLREPEAFSTLRAHEQEVCGLRWSPNSYHLASGGNDNQVLVWDRRWIASEQRTSPHSFRTSTATASASSPFRAHTWAGPAPRATPVLYLNQHTAAVKALAWNPVHPSLLASGGGTDDRTLRFWNTQTGDCLHSLDTGSQVCGVLWSRSGTELVSSHGFSMNQLSVWKYPSLRKVVDLAGHTSRVLHLCLAADGEVVVSAAGDETIRFWRCFPPQPTRVTAGGAAVGAGAGASARHDLGSGSPTHKHVVGTHDMSNLGAVDDAAMGGRRGSAAAATATTSSLWSGFTSPLAASHMSSYSPRSGAGGQWIDAPRFATDEDMVLR